METPGCLPSGRARPVALWAVAWLAFTSILSSAFVLNPLMQPSSFERGASCRPSRSQPAVVMMAKYRTGPAGPPAAVPRPRGRYLNTTEEAVLIKATKRLKVAMDERKKLTLTLERPPTQGEWAEAMGMGQQEFAQELKSWQTASQTLIKFNQGFIGMIVKKYSWLGAEPGDLYQEGCLGYLKAAERFDETRGCRLNTFAYRTVSQFVLTAAARSITFLSVPDHTLPTLMKVSRVKNRVKKEGVSDSEELVDRIAEECGVSRRKAGYLERASRPVTLAPNMADYMETHRCRMVSEAEAYQTPEGLHAVEELRSHVDWALQQLDPTERDIIRMTKGLDDGVRRKPRQVARMLELRTTQLSAMETTAMEKLSRALSPFLPELRAAMRAADSHETSYTSPYVHLQQPKINFL